MIERDDRLKQKQPRNSYKSERASRPTIGLVLPKIGVHFWQLIWSGVVDAARAHNANVVCYIGSTLRSPADFEAQGNVIYELIDPARIDGLVMYSAGIGVFVGSQEMAQFCQQYAPLPTCCLTPLAILLVRLAPLESI